MIAMLFYVDEQDSRPIYQQLVNQVKEHLSAGTIRPGEELPSVRDLADSLGINLHTVRAAYMKLQSEGIIEVRLGRRTRVARRPKLPPAAGEISDLKGRFREVLADALVKGLSPDAVRRLIQEQLDALTLSYKENDHEE
jgi:GntR family transcriptional regulator